MTNKIDNENNVITTESKEATEIPVNIIDKETVGRQAKPTLNKIIAGCLLGLALSFTGGFATAFVCNQFKATSKTKTAAAEAGPYPTIYDK